MKPHLERKGKDKVRSDASLPRSGIRAMRVDENAGAKQEATKAFYIELADEGEGSVYPCDLLQKAAAVVSQLE